MIYAEETLCALLEKAANEIATFYKKAGALIPEKAEKSARRDAKWFGFGFL